MKVIFLDCDGVLNNSNTKERFYCMNKRCVGVTPELLDNLKTIIDATDAKIIMSSTWRQYRECMEYLKNMMGKKLAANIIGQTPTLYFRKDEINRWLKENTEPLGVENFIIIDDMFDEDLQSFGDKFVLTSMNDGLTEDLVEKCIDLLLRQ